jgi:hypothetical protein
MLFPIHRSETVLGDWAFSFKRLEVLRVNQDHQSERKSLQRSATLQQSVRHVRHETCLDPRRTKSNLVNAVYHFADLHGIEAPAGR